jgi:ATP-dependent helicase/nuclease subunit A
MGEWVRYKLDQATDHILVDEAQDTNERQWAIVGALSEEFFAGQGATRRHRTLFTVGDFKQAIFRFQGTNPREFDEARSYFAGKARELRDGAIAINLPQVDLPPDFLDLSMDRSFRSSPPVLRFVDQLLRDLGPEALGLPRTPNAHDSFHTARPGSVTLWEPWTEETESGEDAGEEGWVSDATRRYAACLARQIRQWIERPFTLCWWRASMPRACRSPASTACSCPPRSPFRTCSPPAASRSSRLTTSTSPACWSRPCSAGARTGSTRPPGAATVPRSGRAFATEPPTRTP